jgi:predicted phage baseplate assembly protein
MPLEAPQLDTRTFEELVRLAQLRIPRYTQEWTNFNDSDPGMTLVQLFAWLTEMMLYQMNRVPERNYIKFLKLLNLELRPAKPAQAHLTFTATAGAAVVESVRQRTQVEAQPPEGGDPLVFETAAGLDLIRVPLSDVQVYDGAAFTVVTQANQGPGTPLRPLGWTPQVGSALYLGFQQTQPPVVGRPFPQEMRLRVFLPAEVQAGVAQNCREVQQAPAPPVTLEWEYKPTATAQRWQRLNVYEDSSTAFTREGYILLEGPASIEPTPEGKVQEPRFWLRGRLAAGSYPAGQVPVIDFLRPNTVPAENLVTIREEVVEISEGHPNQVFELRYRPVQPGSLTLEVEVPNQEPEPWTAVADFLASGDEDAHYVLDATTGQIRFGDGRRGRIPVAGAEIIAREYRYGGGKAGNVDSGLINSLRIPLDGVEQVTNERPAVGGQDEQDVEQLKEQAPYILRSQNRAVAVEDFIALAEQAGGVARATAIALAHPHHPGVEVPGAITVVIVPDTDETPPQPSSDLIRQVCQYLDRFRLLTTEVYVKGPEYQPITVEARVVARPYAAFDAVAQDVEKALNAALDPRSWAFAQELYPTNLYGVILGVENVAAVHSLTLIVNGRPHDNLAQAVVVPADGLVYGTDHQITVVPLTNV